MNWVAALRSMFDNPDADVGPVLFDTGCSRSCTPNLDDFVDELEYGDFGRIQTAEKDMYHTIRARGLMRLHVIDSLGRISDITVPANYTPDVPLRLVSPQDYFQFHMMLDTESIHFGGCAFDFTFRTAEGIKLRMRLDPGSNLPLLACQSHMDNKLSKQASDCSKQSRSSQVAQAYMNNPNSPLLNPLGVFPR
jgi:hypothetical protein